MIDHLGEIDSTNAELVRRAEMGATAGSVLVADLQRAGRGRLGREWVAPAGSSLLCSVLLDAPAHVGPQWLLGATALSLADALGDTTGERPQLKWPNDVLYGDLKVAGLLAEFLSSPPRVVVGLGVNLTSVDPAYPAATSVLAATRRRLEAADLLSAFLDAFGRRLDLLDTPEGGDVLRREYRGALSTLGQRVRVEQVGGVLSGVAVGVDDDGALVVDTGAATLAFHAGDVVHLRREDH